MGSETKLGLVFVGILVTVFCALLIKRLTKPGSLPNAAIAGASVGKTVESTTTARYVPPVAPKVVPPASEISKPPDYAYGSQVAVATKPTSGTTGSKYDESSRALSGSNPSSNYGRSDLQSPSSVMGNTPIADLGNQYANNSTSPPTDRWQSSAASSLFANETASKTSLPVPHQSGYGSAGAGPTASISETATTPAANHAVDPPARIDASDAQSVDRSAATTIPQYQPYQSLASTPTSAAASNPMETPKTSSTTVVDPSYTNNDGYSLSNARSKNLTSGALAAGNPSAGASQPIQTAANQPMGNQPPANQYNYSSSYGTPATTVAAITPTTPPVQRNGEQYTVEPNDSYWAISEKMYGSGGYFKALYEYNRKRSKFADELKLGQVLLVPEEGVLRRAYPDLCPKPRKLVASGQQRLTSATGRLSGSGKVYTVTEGDTLFEIARHELGKPARWAEIYSLNREVLGDDTDYLRPGTELILPVSGDSAPRNNTATRQPSPVYSR